MVVFGRAAMGEKMLHGEFVDRWRLRRGGRLVFAETVRLDGDIGEKLARPAVANGGVAIGTALMLLECSKVGATIDVDAIPRPQGVPLLRWLTSFPSFGFVLSVRPEALGEVLTRFSARDIACSVVGQVDDSRTLVLRQGDERQLLWDLNTDAFIGEAGEVSHA